MKAAALVLIVATFCSGCTTTPQKRVDAVAAVIREEHALPRFESRLKGLGARIVDGPGFSERTAYLLVDSKLHGAVRTDLVITYSFNEKLEVRCEDQSIATLTE